MIRTKIADATSTKQSLSSTTGLVVLASDSKRFYLHNFLSLGPAGAPAITSFEPVSGPTGTSVTLLGTHFTGTTRVAFSGAVTTFAVVSDTQIDTTVPDGSPRGRISVTNAAGTAYSRTEFAVLNPVPTCSSF
jgi:hypothetical protein